MSKASFYVLRTGKKVHRIAKIENGCAYGWEAGSWEYMPGLIKIQNSMTDYEEISEAEAKALIKEMSK